MLTFSYIRLKFNINIHFYNKIYSIFLPIEKNNSISKRTVSKNSFQNSLISKKKNYVLRSIIAL